MDFSSDVLIDVGLNLAGYLVMALLVYLIVKKHPVNDRATYAKSPAAKPEAAATVHSAAMPRKAAPAIEPEFVSLLATKRPAAGTGRPAPISADVSVSGEWRRQNRRAIYAEARRLLARGDSPSDLMTKLPVTESELDMLTVTGRA